MSVCLSVCLSVAAFRNLRRMTSLERRREVLPAGSAHPYSQCRKSQSQSSPPDEHSFLSQAHSARPLIYRSNGSMPSEPDPQP
jgi:hypothetical protein